MSNYPPGVTGNEFEIAGPDYEQEIEGYCPGCGKSDCLMEQGYQGQRWRNCSECDYEEDIEVNKYDSDPRV